MPGRHLPPKRSTTTKVASQLNGHVPRTATPAKAAKEAGLRYVSDALPGITRKRSGKSFRYFNASGKLIRDRKTLDRIRSLVIPPAWKDVWICPLAHGHIQAVGRDTRRRKQYIYHPDWRIIRDETKYDQMLAFARMLPKIRRRVRADLSKRGLSREKVLATVVKLLEVTHIRVGNEEYAKSNHSFGLTTFRRKHVDVGQSIIRFEFRGKSGIEHEVDVHDRKLASILRACHELPGQELFQYVDENGEVHDVTSNDVNAYLQEITGSNFTAKDFRTWAGTSLAAKALHEAEEYESETAAKRIVTQAIRLVAQRLGNTVSVCRKCYVHPAVIDAYLDRSLSTYLQVQSTPAERTTLIRLSSEETAIVKLLQRQRRRRESDSKSRRVQSANADR